MTEKKKTSTQGNDQALVQVPQNRMLTYEEVEKVAKAFVASGMFGRDMERISQGITKIMAGQELGMAPFASMRAIHIIDGNATLSANTMAAMVKRSNRYDYVVKEKSTERCEIEFYEVRDGKRSKVGVETFDKSEAQAAGLLNKNNWRNYPKAMMFARCMSNGVRTYAPDVFNGMLVYTPDEMGGKVDLSGDYANAIDGEVAEPAPAAPKTQEPAAEPEAAAEPDIPEGDVVQDSPADDVDQTPPLDVTDELKEEVQLQFDSLGLNSRGKMWFMKTIEAKPYAKWEQLTEDQWRRAYDLIQDILNARVEVDDSHVAGMVSSEPEESAAPVRNFSEPKSEQEDDK